MNLDDLEEALADILPSNFSIERDKHGQLIILTGFRQDDDGELVDFRSFDDEEDDDFDPDFEPLEEELDDEV